VISSSQRPLPDNTQHSQQTDIHALGGIRTHNFSTRAAADLRLTPHGHWDRPLVHRASNIYFDIRPRNILHRPNKRISFSLPTPRGRKRKIMYNFLILKLGIRYRRVVSFTIRPLCPRGKLPPRHCHHHFFQTILHDADRVWCTGAARQWVVLPMFRGSSLRPFSGLKRVGTVSVRNYTNRRQVWRTEEKGIKPDVLANRNSEQGTAICFVVSFSLRKI